MLNQLKHWSLLKRKRLIFSREKCEKQVESKAKSPFDFHLTLFWPRRNILDVIKTSLLIFSYLFIFLRNNNDSLLKQTICWLTDNPDMLILRSPFLWGEDFLSIQYFMPLNNTVTDKFLRPWRCKINSLSKCLLQSWDILNCLLENSSISTDERDATYFTKANVRNIHHF